MLGDIASTSTVVDDEEEDDEDDDEEDDDEDESPASDMRDLSVPSISAPSLMFGSATYMQCSTGR